MFVYKREGKKFTGLRWKLDQSSAPQKLIQKKNQ